jgi:hypothetical protein
MNQFKQPAAILQNIYLERKNVTGETMYFIGRAQLNLTEM